MDTTLRRATLSYKEFRENHLLPNKPVIIGPDLVSSWPARTLWAVPDPNASFSRPNFDVLFERYADLVVPVDQEGCRSTIVLKAVLDAWRKGEGQNLYVKDWHLARQCPQDRFYDTPDIFKDDWMNRYYCVETEDDFRFVVRTAISILKFATDRDRADSTWDLAQLIPHCTEMSVSTLLCVV